jgi:hypothetical protein
MIYGEFSKRFKDNRWDSFIKKLLEKRKLQNKPSQHIEAMHSKQTMDVLILPNTEYPPKTSLENDIYKALIFYTLRVCSIAF